MGRRWARPKERGTAGQRAAASRKLVLALIRGAGDRGCTCDEVAAATGRSPNQVSGRFTELARMGLIQRAGLRRKTRAGSEAHVWVEVRQASERIEA